MRVALDTNILAYAEGLGDARRCEQARVLLAALPIESSFALLKRGLIGTFHSVSEQHRQRYATEFDFRWHHRVALGVNDVQRTTAVLKGIEGKRLTYRA